MNGRALLITLFLIGLIATASAGERQVNGKIECDGQQFEHELFLRASGKPVVDSLVAAKKDGSFSLALREGADGEVYIWPANDRPFAEKKGAFLLGYTRFAPDAEQPIVLRLKSVPITLQKITVKDQDGNPVPNISTKLKVQVPMGSDIRYPFCSFQCKLASDKDGVIEFPVAPVANAQYQIGVDSSLPDGSRSTGKASYSTEDLLKAKGETFQLKVNRQALSLIISAVWDPDYSQEPFKPNLQLIDRHVIAIKEVEGTKRLLGKDGTVKYYGLKHGAYTLTFPQENDRAYQIVRKTEQVAIPEDTQLPVKHTLMIRPVELKELRGRLVDQDTGKPIADASVACGRTTALSDEHGAFSLKLANDTTARINIRHEKYSPESFPVPVEFSSIVPTTFKLKALPELAGRLTYKGSKVPIMDAKVILTGTGDIRYKTRTDKFGRYSLQVPAGKYLLQVTGVYGKTKEFDGKSVLLYSNQVSVSAKDEEKWNVEVPQVKEITIKVVETGKSEDLSAKALLILRPSDHVYVAVGSITAGEANKIYVPEGEYEVLVVRDEVRGTVCGKITVDAGDQKIFRLEVVRWDNYEFGQNRIVKVTRATQGS